MITAADRQALLPVLDDLCRAVEEIVATGLTAASEATVARLDVAFREASRLKLGRLAASLRYASEEIGRYLRSSPEFSARRLTLFLNRGWIVAKGLRKAIAAGDEPTIARLTFAPAAPAPQPSVDVVVMGVQKRVARTNGSFEFRLREVGTGRPLVWSFVFAKKADLPGEAWLHLPQPQKFEPRVLLGDAVVTMTQVAIAPEGGRVLLGPKATVAAGRRFDDWEPLLAWDRARAIERVRAHRPSPLDLEVELAEEVVLRDWTIGPAVQRDQRCWPVRAGSLHLEARAPAGEEGRELGDALEALRVLPTRPPLFGVLHYDLCRLVLTPLATYEAGRMRHLMVSGASIDKKKLLAILAL